MTDSTRTELGFRHREVATFAAIEFINNGLAIDSGSCFALRGVSTTPQRRDCRSDAESFRRA
jgi:hypothetical protein